MRDLYDRPWARIWEQYFEKGMKRPAAAARRAGMSWATAQIVRADDVVQECLVRALGKANRWLQGAGRYRDIARRAPRHRRPTIALAPPDRPERAHANLV